MKGTLEYRRAVAVSLAVLTATWLVELAQSVLMRQESSMAGVVLILLGLFVEVWTIWNCFRGKSGLGYVSLTLYALGFLQPGSIHIVLHGNLPVSFVVLFAVTGVHVAVERLVHSTIPPALS